MPAQAVIEELQKRGGWEIFYLGRKYGMEDDRAEALEYQEIRKLPSVTYLVLTTGRIQPKFFVNFGQSIKAFLKIFVGLAQSLWLILRYHPDVVLSFGGYMAIPVVFWAFLLGIPMATHEQTVTSGRANKLIALLADEVFISWGKPGPKEILTGNPLRKAFLQAIKHRRTKTSPPTIYITGGNQGSHVLNVAVKEALPKLAKYKVIHQTGDAKQFNDYLELASHKSNHYEPKKFLTADEVADIFSCASLIVSRSGANIVTEILAFGKPALFIPIPWSHQGEQMANAKMVADLGLGEILPQDELSAASLVKKISTMMANLSRYRAKVEIPLDASGKIADALEKVVI